jgi:hypothetical protein
LRAIGLGGILLSVAAVALSGQPAAADGDNPADGPTASSLCENFLGHPSPYQALGPNVDVINQDGVAAAGDSVGCATPQNEPTVAVNPANPENIVAGSNDYRIFNTEEHLNDSTGWAYTSFDGGLTWRDVALPKIDFQTGATGALGAMGLAGDPSITFGPNNTVYYGELVESRAAEPIDQQAPTGIVVSVSRDGGLTWGAPAIVDALGVAADGTPTPTNVADDKEWIAADPHSGTVYITWLRLVDDSNGNLVESPVVVSASHDFGRTWSKPTQVSPDMLTFTGGISSIAKGPNPQVGNDGTLYVAYKTTICQTATCSPTDKDAVVMAISHDGGRTFTNTEVASDFGFPIDDDTGGNAALTGENFRINSFPQLAYDRVTNHLWITWADDRDGRYVNGQSVLTNGDVLLTDSPDGVHWSTPSVIGTGSDEVFPAVAALANHVAVSFYTRAYDPNGVDLDYAYVAGIGRGVASSPIHRITTQSSDPGVQFSTIGVVTGHLLQGWFDGDYTAIAMGSDFRIHPVWTDFRGDPGTTLPNQDILTQSISVAY